MKSATWNMITDCHSEGFYSSCVVSKISTEEKELNWSKAVQDGKISDENHLRVCTQMGQKMSKVNGQNLLCEH